MDLRGFDSYDISLGDEMRGERASLGKSLEDVERDLKIKSKMLVAIEDCDLSGFKNQSVIAGYVRSYARYLGMDADDCYARFCAESGYRSPAAIMSDASSGSGFGAVTASVSSKLGATHLAESRFAAPPSRSRFQARVTLGAITSALALVALIAGLSYGGYALLQEFQRVSFSPLPEAPRVVGEAPRIDAPDLTVADTDKRPDASAYAGGGALAAAAATPSDLSPGPRPRRDGPISAIDPRHASLFGRTAPAAPTGFAGRDLAPSGNSLVARTPDQTSPTPRSPVGGALAANTYGDSAPRIPRVESDPSIGRLDEKPIVARTDTQIPAGGPAPTPTDAEALTTAEAPAAETGPAERGIALLATGDAWMEVRDRDKAIVFTGNLKPGQEVRLPNQILSPKMISGNAGATYLIVDGIAYGPLGGRGEVRKNFPVTAAEIRAALPQADLVALRGGEGTKVIEVAPVANAGEKVVLPPKRPRR